MKYFKLSELLASRVAQGCMRMAELDFQQADRLIRSDLDCGINFFDHADIYGGGRCEQLFGDVLRADPGLRRKMLIQTKCAIHDGLYDFSAGHITASVEGSLRRLGVDSIDFLLLHRPDALCEPEEVAETFEKLRRQGKVKHFGVSNHNAMQLHLLRQYLKEDLVINQLQFSLAHAGMIDTGLNVNLDNAPAPSRDGYVLDYCRLNDITIQAWSPLQYGFFQGTFLGSPEYPELNQVLDELAETYSVTPAAIAIAWILRHPACMQPVAGTVNPDHMAQICQACGVSLTRPEWYRLYRAAGKTLP